MPAAKQNHEANSTAKTNGVASYTSAVSKVNSNNNLRVDIGNASISGYETLYIYSVAKSLKENSKSYASIAGLTGKVYSTSETSGSTVSNINVGNSKYRASLYGPDILIEDGLANGITTDKAIVRDATASGDTVVNTVTRTIEKVEYVVEKIVSWLPWPFSSIIKWITKKVTKLVTEVVKVITYSDAEAYRNGSYNVNGNVNVNLDLYCGEFASGINILIDEDKKSNYYRS